MNTLLIAQALTENTDAISGFIDSVANLLPFPWNLVAGAVAGVISFFGAKKIAKKNAEKKAAEKTNE